MTHRLPTCVKTWRRKTVHQNISQTIHQWKKRRVRVRVWVRDVPAQPEPGAREDEGHPEKTTVRLEGRRAAKEGHTGTQTHIITRI